ncbi:hypothetical protein Y032_0561g3483 [Ancylostoma ceylanicum]|nr:hypothetical protein Y032_0561g3483 [Ancylostoma ceylanicum]
MKVLLRDQYLETEKRTSLHKTTTTETKDCGSGSRSSKYVKNSLLSMVLPLPHHHSSYGIRQSINNVDAFHKRSQRSSHMKTAAHVKKFSDDSVSGGFDR